MKSSGKERTKTFTNIKTDKPQRKSQNFGYSPERSEGKSQRYNQDLYKIRFRRKDLESFEPKLYVTAQLTIDDVIDLKQVFDTYDSTGMGVLLPNDLILLLTQNGFNPSKKTVYEIIAQFDIEEAGGICFGEFMQAMGVRPIMTQSKKEIAAVFKKYDRTNKGFIELNDLREIDKHIKENLDQETLRLMLEKSDSNNDGRVTFEDFYSVMTRSNF